MDFSRRDGIKHDQVSERGGYLVVKLGHEDVEKGGAFVRLERVIGAISKAMGSTNQEEAVSEISSRIVSGVQQGLLNPLTCDTLVPMSKNAYDAGVVPFAELYQWGRQSSSPGENSASVRYHFQLDEATLYPNVKSLFERIKEVERRIEYWSSRDDTTASNAEIMQRNLQPLRDELVLLEKEKLTMRGDYVEPEPLSQPVLPGLACAENAAREPAWTVTKSKRYAGYAAPLDRLMAAAHRRGDPCPTARDVVEAWRIEKPAEIAKVLTDSVDYYDSNGDTQTVSLDSIRKAIDRRKAPGKRPVGVRQAPGKRPPSAR